MTIGRMTTALGAFALGLATAGPLPALAQTNTGGTNPPAAAPATPPAASPMPATPPVASPAPSTSTSGRATNQAAAPTRTHPRSRVARTSRRPMGTRTASRANESNPNAQDAAIDQLNQQSLQAAQQGKPFSPSGKM